MVQLLNHHLKDLSTDMHHIEAMFQRKRCVTLRSPEDMEQLTVQVVDTYLFGSRKRQVKTTSVSVNVLCAYFFVSNRRDHLDIAVRRHAAAVIGAYRDPDVAFLTDRD